jgi:hypothetical protein
MSHFLIDEYDYERLPEQSKRQYQFCHKCGGYFNTNRLSKCICQIDENRIEHRKKVLTEKEKGL